jgi:hypothetical protein
VAALYALPLGIKQKIQRPIRLGQFVPELVEHLEAVVALKPGIRCSDQQVDVRFRPRCAAGP